MKDSSVAKTQEPFYIKIITVTISYMGLTVVRDAMFVVKVLCRKNQNWILAA